MGLWALRLHAVGQGSLVAVSLQWGTMGVSSSPSTHLNAQTQCLCKAEVAVVVAPAASAFAPPPRIPAAVPLLKP